MFLAVDIGNTNITLGIFDEGNLIKTYRVIADNYISVREYEHLFGSLLKNFQISDCVIGSVYDEISAKIKAVIDKTLSLEAVLLENSMEFGINIPKSKESAGIDRIANAVSALKYDLPAIVVDIGTAVTFDVVSKEKDFLGGIIMPGVNTQLKSLHDYTSKLPLIEPKESECAIGTDTESCILSGVVRGIAGAIDGLILNCEEELGGKATIILTGGQCELISKYMISKIDFVETNLTLYGLKDIFNSLKIPSDTCSR